MSIASYFVLQKYNYDLRNIFNLIFENSIKTKLYIKRLIENISFKEKHTDFLLTCQEDEIDKLLKGYTETNYNDYLKEYYNSVLSNQITNDSQYQVFKRDFMITENDGINISFNNNIVNILDIETKNIIFNIKYNYKIIDFKIDEEGFVYIFYLKDNRTFLAKTHINFNFFMDNKNHYNHINKFETIQKLFDIEIEKYKELLFCENEFIYYLDTDNKIRRIELCRKYYFKKDGQVFYNSLDKTQEAIQIEHLHIYDYISVLGLNDFNYKGFKISSFDIKDLEEIMLFKFDSSLNGVLNYYDFGKSYKSYKINKDLKFIKIIGNFNYNFEKDKFKIKLLVNKNNIESEATVNIELIKNGMCLKKLNCKTCDNILYFCNLKFIFYCEVYDNIELEIDLNITDDYSAKIKRIIKNIDSDDISHNDFDRIFKMQQVLFKEGKFKKQLVEIDYKDGDLIIIDYIKDSNGRYFGKNYKLKIIEEDGTPSLLWRKIEDKDYYFCFRQHIVTKILKPKSTKKELFKISRDSFKLNLSKIIK